jgi:iron complex transport system ATP-binding protein
VVSIESLDLGYGPRTVLAGVSLAVARGTVTALIGPNGAGKSTLIRAASGVLAPRAGRVLVDGEDVARLAPDRRARKVAVVPQAVHLPEAFTALDTVLLGRTAYLGWLGRETAADQEAARQAMARTSTLELAERRLGELSGGERQLVLIAHALAQAAPVLLLDEPTAHLDLRHQAEVLALVTRLAHADGFAVLMALHDVNHAARHADRVAVLAGGRLAAAGEPAEVLTAPVLSTAYGLPVKVIPHPDGGRPLIFAE